MSPWPQAPGAEPLEAFVENAPCGLLLSSGEGTILGINRTLLNLLQYEAEELCGKKSLSDLMTVAARIYFETHYAPLLQIQGFVSEVAVDLVQKNGRQLPVFLSSTCQRTAAGEPLLVRTAIIPAVDRRKYERELLLARRAAEQAVQAKADFLAMFAHEIRNPLAAISVQVQLLARQVLLPAQEKPLSRLRGSMEKLLVLINNMLDISRIDAGRAALVEGDTRIRDVFSAVVHTFAASAEAKRISLTTVAPPELPTTVAADAMKLDQALTNLVGNAIKFTEQGFVAIGADVVERSDHDVRLRFWVKDSGIGISREAQAQIFDPYVQADPNIQKRFGGTGLGLAITQKLVELQGGRLRVDSEPGKGSTFWFELRLKIRPDNEQPNHDARAS